MSRTHISVTGTADEGCIAARINGRRLQKKFNCRHRSSVSQRAESGNSCMLTNATRLHSVQLHAPDLANNIAEFNVLLDTKA